MKLIEIKCDTRCKQIDSRVFCPTNIGCAVRPARVAVYKTYWQEEITLKITNNVLFKALTALVGLYNMQIAGHCFQLFEMELNEWI